MAYDFKGRQFDPAAAASQYQITQPEPEQEEAGFFRQATTAAGAVGEAVLDVGTEFGQAIRGATGSASVVDPQQYEDYTRHQTDIAADLENYKGVYGEDSFLGEMVAGTRQSLAQSALSMIPGVAAGVAGATGIGVPAAAALAAASGGIAYAGSAYDAEMGLLLARKMQVEDVQGGVYTQAMEDADKALFADKVMQYGLAEAVPELIGNFGVGAIMSRLPGAKSLLSKGLRVAGMQGVEHGTETTTGVLQSGIMAGTPGGPERQATVGEAFRAQAPTTTALGLLTGGAGKIAHMGVNARKDAVYRAALPLTDQQITEVGKENVRKNAVSVFQAMNANPELSLTNEEMMAMLKGATLDQVVAGREAGGIKAQALEESGRAEADRQQQMQAENEALLERALAVGVEPETVKTSKGVETRTTKPREQLEREIIKAETEKLDRDALITTAGQLGIPIQEIRKVKGREKVHTLTTDELRDAVEVAQFQRVNEVGIEEEQAFADVGAPAPTLRQPLDAEALLEEEAGVEQAALRQRSASLGEEVEVAEAGGRLEPVEPVSDLGEVIPEEAEFEMLVDEFVPAVIPGAPAEPITPPPENIALFPRAC
jgi:hypothetical protein